ncbi:unnamed protein product [Agarophyton chilense]
MTGCSRLTELIPLGKKKLNTFSVSKFVCKRRNVRKKKKQHELKHENGLSKSLHETEPHSGLTLINSEGIALLQSQTDRQGRFCTDLSLTEKVERATPFTWRANEWIPRHGRGKSKEKMYEERRTTVPPTPSIHCPAFSARMSAEGPEEKGQPRRDSSENASMYPIVSRSSVPRSYIFGKY